MRVGEKILRGEGREIWNLGDLPAWLDLLRGLCWRHRAGQGRAGAQRGWQGLVTSTGTLE